MIHVGSMHFTGTALSIEMRFNVISATNNKLILTK